MRRKRRGKDRERIAEGESGRKRKKQVGGNRRGGKNKRSRRGERIKGKQERMHAVEEPVGGDLPIKRHSARLSDL